jgi:hypothetical protein
VTGKLRFVAGQVWVIHGIPPPAAPWNGPVFCARQEMNEFLSQQSNEPRTRHTK